jgi:hypothetical protein
MKPILNNDKLTCENCTGPVGNIVWYADGKLICSECARGWTRTEREHLTLPTIVVVCAIGAVMWYVFLKLFGVL